MNHYLLLAVSMTVAWVSGIGSKYYISKYKNGEHTDHIYNTVSSLIAMLALFLWNDGFHVSAFTLILGIGFGALTAVQRIFCLKAMKLGPWSYTAVIASLSTIIPTLSGSVIWGETISIVQAAGIALMLVCICLASDLKNDGSSKTVKWMVYCGIVFLMTGMIGVFQKWHQNTAFRGELDEFLIIAFFISTLFTGVLAVQTRKEEHAAEKRKQIFTVVPVFIMLFSGASVAVNNKLNLFLSGVLDSSIMFPIVNGGGLMLTTVAATLFFREKLSKKQWVGLLIGVAAVILLCNPF